MSENLTAEELADLKAKAPICRLPVLDDALPAWQQVDLMAQRHGVERIPYRLRDEMVTMLSWAKYGQALHDARVLTALEEAEGRLDEAELFDAESDAAFKDLDAQIEALTARAEKAEQMAAERQAVVDAARIYFNDYMLDEADPDYRVWGVCEDAQHKAAKALGDALAALAPQHGGGDA